MTVTATNRKNQFTTNGVTTEFTFDFAITDTSQVNAFTVVDGVETEYTNFTVELSDDTEGGVLTTGDTLSGVDLLIYRNVSLTQQVDYESGGKFPADSHEQALDKLTLQNQDQQEELDRSVKSSISNATTYTIRSLDDGKLIALSGSELVSVDATIDDAETLNEYVDFAEEWTDGDEATATTPSGKVVRTIQGVNDDADDAIASLNESADKANNTTDFFDLVTTGGTNVTVTNPNNNETVPSVQKQIKDLYDADGNSLRVYADQAETARDEAVAAASETSELQENLDIKTDLEDNQDYFHIPDKLYFWQGQETSIYTRNLLPSRQDGAGAVLSLEYNTRDESDPMMRKLSLQSDRELRVNSDMLQSGFYEAFLSLRYQYFTKDQRQYKSVDIFVAPEQPSYGKDLSILAIGDSNIKRQFTTVSELTLTQKGYNPTFIGTVSGWDLDNSYNAPVGEGRGGWNSKDYTNRNSKTPVTDVGAYLALSDSAKENYNPFIREATELDDEDEVFNGYIFDFADYLSKFSLDTPDYVVIGLGGNNVTEYTDTDEEMYNYFVDDLKIMAESIMSAAPNARVGILIRGAVRTEGEDLKWNRYRLIQKAAMVVSNEIVSTNIRVLPAWAHMSSEAGYPLLGSTNPDSDTGVAVGDIADEVHPKSDRATRFQFVDTATAWMGALQTHPYSKIYHPTYNPLANDLSLFLNGGSQAITPASQINGINRTSSSLLISRKDSGAFGSYLALAKVNEDESLPSPGDVIGSVEFHAWNGSQMRPTIRSVASVNTAPLSGEGVDGKFEMFTEDSSKSQVKILEVTTLTVNPGADNRASCGDASNRYTDVYAANSIISTSDERLKQFFDIDEAEKRAVKKIKFKKFKWNDDIESKGDNARYHFGVSAQQVISSFESEGLNPFEYGIVCTDIVDGEERYSVRYSEMYSLLMSTLIG